MNKKLISNNCYDASETMIIIGTCLPHVQPKAYMLLEKISNNIYELCLEETHLNMAFSKIIGILSRVKVKKIVFATVDKSPHCVQMHYIESEIKKAKNIDDIEIVHYVAVDDELIKISEDTIKKSKNLSQLENNKKLKNKKSRI